MCARWDQHTLKVAHCLLIRAHVAFTVEPLRNAEGAPDRRDDTRKENHAHARTVGAAGTRFVGRRRDQCCSRNMCVMPPSERPTTTYRAARIAAYRWSETESRPRGMREPSPSAIGEDAQAGACENVPPRVACGFITVALPPAASRTIGNAGRVPTRTAGVVMSADVRKHPVATVLTDVSSALPRRMKATAALPRPSRCLTCGDMPR
jgi:hypothetical protein